MSVPTPEPAPPYLVQVIGTGALAASTFNCIVGSGIFVTPAEVARHVDTPLLIVGVWVLGGLVALVASFVYAELAARRPAVGGQYAYLRDAYGPMPAFLYGWALLLVIQSGGMAAVAITFARYFGNLVHLPVSESVVAVSVLGLLTLINCMGVRSGSNVQSALMVLKIGAIGGIIALRFGMGRRKRHDDATAEPEAIEVAPPVRPHPVSKKKKKRRKRTS